MAHKIVMELELGVECPVEDVDKIVANLRKWFAPGTGQQTQGGIDWVTSAVQVTYDGVVEPKMTVTANDIPDEPQVPYDPRFAYELTKEQAFASWPCGVCGVRRDEHSDQEVQSAFPWLDITGHNFVESPVTLEAGAGPMTAIPDTIEVVRRQGEVTIAVDGFVLEAGIIRIEQAIEYREGPQITVTLAAKRITVDDDLSNYGDVR